MAHDHGHHGHHHGTERLGLTILLNIIITVSQVIGGLLSGSLSLLSDAAHNFSDVIALIVSYIGGKLATKPFTDEKTFGYKRAEIIAALTNVVSIMVIGCIIFIEAMKRLSTPIEVNSSVVIGLAFLSIIMNGASVLLIQKSAKDNLNIKSAYLHLFSDMLTSIAVMMSGIAMYYWKWFWLDTVLSVAIAFYLMVTSMKMLLETLSILMLFAPKKYDANQLIHRLCEFEEVTNVHHIHAWQLTDRDFHFEAHIMINRDMNISETTNLKHKLKKVIKTLGFTHVTIELDFEECLDDDCTNEKMFESNHSHHHHA
jgi:cobalt-zinc-cadmium efflux system protein